MGDRSLTSARVVDRACAHSSESGRKHTRRHRAPAHVRRRWVGGCSVPADLDAEVERELKKLLRRKSPPPRTSTILQELHAGIDPERTVTAEHVKAWAMVLRVKLARGALPGVKRAPGGGRPKGAVSSVHRDRVRELRAEGRSMQSIATELGISKALVVYLASDDPAKESS